MSDDWRPLSARVSDEAAKAYEQLHEGVPAHLGEALKLWLVEDFLELPRDGEYRRDRAEDERMGRLFLQEFEVKSGRTIQRRGSIRQTLEGPFDSPLVNRDLLLDLLDYGVRVSTGEARSLERILEQGRSVWTVDHETKGLVGRVPGVDAALAAMDGLPGAQLRMRSAWAKAFGLHPDPTAAYDEAVRAVEAAFCSAILPKADKPTLGTVIRALKDDPSKLQHVWPASDGNGRSAAEATQALMQLLWRNQGWRHGSEDPKAPTSASPEQAKAAFHLALVLMSWRVSGVLRAAPKT